MNELYYENQGSYTYLVYEVHEQDAVDTMSLGMLTNNKIQGLAQTLFVQIDNKKLIKFNVSAKVSVSQFFSGVVNKKRLLGVFNGIVNAMLLAEDYMLEEKSILMDMDYIFTDVSTCETVLICLPIENMKNRTVDLKMFFRNIMFSTQFDQTENCDYVARIMNFLNASQVLSLQGFKDLLEEMEDGRGVSGSVMVKSESQQVSVASEQSDKESVAERQPCKQVVVQPQQSVQTQQSVQQITMQSRQSAQQASLQSQQLAQPTTSKTDKEISWWYLMQHYNKENAATYKAQKKAKKREAEEIKGKQKNAKKKAQQEVNAGFAVPGQSEKMHKEQMQQQQMQQQQIQQQQVHHQTMNFGETTVLRSESSGETTVLKAPQAEAKMATPHLIRAKNNEKISLNKPVYRIGKERSYVDYFIGDNTAISRSHANFIVRDGEYFVVDTNSTNHTFVNDKMIQSNVETKISHGDKIRLANEDFEFRVYGV